MSALRTVFGEDASLLTRTEFQTLLVANIHPPLGVILLSPLLDSLTGVYGVNEARVGLLMTAYTAPAILVTPIVGYMSDLYGRKVLLVLGLLTFGVAGISLSLTESFTVAILLRFLQGIGAVGITPVIVMSLGDLYTGTTEVTAQGLRFSSAGAAQAVFPIASGVLAGIAWYYPLLLYGLALPSAVVVALWLEEPTEEIGTATSGTDVRSRLSRIVSAIREPPLGTLIVARAVPPMLWFAYVTYVSVIAIQLLSGSPETAGQLLAITSVVYAITATQAGRLSTLFPGRVVPVIAGNLAMGGGLVGFAYAPGSIHAAVAAVAIGFGFGITLTFYRSLINELAPDSDRGSIVSIAETGDRVAATLTPAVIGICIVGLSPTVSLLPAVQLTLGTVGVLGALVSTGCVLVAIRADGSALSVGE